MNTIDDIGYDFQIIKVQPQTATGGAWVDGRVAGHRFSALVFKDHAESPEWEMGDSRISKLWLKRLSDGRVVFNWDRGADVPPADEVASDIVDFLCSGLADTVR